MKEKARCPKVFVFVKVCGRFWCQKWSKVVWMDGRQSGVQKDRLGNFHWKNFSIELWLYTGLLRLLIASEVSEGRVWCVRACELWGQVWLQKFWPFGVCQEDVLENLMEENWWCPCLYIWNAILHALDWGVYLIWMAGIVQLGVICKRLVRNGVLLNECSKRCTNWIEWVPGQNLVERQSWARLAVKCCWW